MASQAGASAAAPRSRARGRAHASTTSELPQVGPLVSDETTKLVQRALQVLDLVLPGPAVRTMAKDEQDAHRELVRYARDETVRALDALLEDDDFWTVEQKRSDGAPKLRASELFKRSLAQVLATSGYNPPPPAERLVASARNAIKEIEDLEGEHYEQFDWLRLAYVARSRVRTLANALEGMELVPSKSRFSLLLRGKSVLLAALAASIAVPGLAAQDIAKDYLKDVYNVYVLHAVPASDDGEEPDLVQEADLSRALLEAQVRKAEAEAQLAELRVQAARTQR